MSVGIKNIIAIILLLSLGVVLYFSASGFFNVLLVPRIVASLSAQDMLSARAFILLISLASALIAGFFSVFLFEMISDWRPWLSGLLFALPVMILSAVFASISGISADVIFLYLQQFAVIIAAYLLMAYVGRYTGRRFFG